MGLQKCLFESIIRYNEKSLPFVEVIFLYLQSVGTIFFLFSYRKGSEHISIVSLKRKSQFFKDPEKAATVGY